MRTNPPKSARIGLRAWVMWLVIVASVLGALLPMLRRGARRFVVHLIREQWGFMELAIDSRTRAIVREYLPKK